MIVVFGSVSYDYYPSSVKGRGLVHYFYYYGYKEGSMIHLKVKEVAELKGFSMGRLHRDAGVDRKTIQRVYREPLSEISTITLDRIATALGVHPCDLIEYTPNPPRTPPTETS